MLCKIKAEFYGRWFVVKSRSYLGEDGIVRFGDRYGR
jgi:hypothetical protein